MADQSSLEARAGTAAGNSADRMELPKLAPDTVRAEARKVEPVKLDGGVADAFKVETPRTAGKIFVASTTNRIRENRAAISRPDPAKADASKVDMSKVDIPRVGKIAASSPADRTWDKTSDSKSTAAKAAAEAGKAAQPLKQDVGKARISRVAGVSRIAGASTRTASRIVGQIIGSLPKVRTLASWRPRIASPKAEVRAEAASASPGRAASASSAPTKRRMSSLVAMAAIAAAAGAVGGVVATTLLPQVTAEAAMSTSDTPTLEASVARIDADVQALKAGTEPGGQPVQGLDSQTSDRLDRLERVEAESSAKIVRLNDATERLRVAVQSASGTPAPVPPAASRETTGSATQTSGAASAFGALRPAATPKPVSPGKLPIVPGWSLRDVNHGLALIEGRNGFYEVYAGDPIPGLGRVDSIRRQDGRWVVVTTKGLVVSR